MEIISRFSSKSSQRNIISKGFTVIELIMVVSITSLLAVMYSTLGSNFIIASQTDNTVDELLGSLRVAQLNTISGKNSARWGVRIENNQIILFSGDDWVSRDTKFDEIFVTSGQLQITPNFSEVVFEKSSGNSAPSVFQVSNNIGEIHDITVNDFGNVDVE
jgi:prepilin-type N-terminal cleavage/methylation domain-containing protein